MNEVNLEKHNWSGNNFILYIAMSSSLKQFSILSMHIDFNKWNSQRNGDLCWNNQLMKL